MESYNFWKTCTRRLNQEPAGSQNVQIDADHKAVLTETLGEHVPADLLVD